MHNKPYFNNYAGKYYDQAKGKLYLATTDKEEQYNFAYDFLKNNGFEYTPERINKSLNANLVDDIEKVLGFSLTDSEKEILIKLDRKSTRLNSSHVSISY